MTVHPRALHRLATTMLVVLALLFSQLALAGYACPTGSHDEPPVMVMAPGEPCAGVASDDRQPVLCHQHCADAAQSFDPLKPPTASLPAVVQVLPLPVVTDAAERHAQFHARHRQAQPPPEPVFLSTLRLRV